MIIKKKRKINIFKRNIFQKIIKVKYIKQIIYVKNVVFIPEIKI